MARLEISFYFDTSTEYSFNQPSVKNQFQHYVSNLIEKLTNQVLNKPLILKLVYRKLSIFNLIQNLSQVRNNLLAIGVKTVWLINCATTANDHFVGTCRATELKLPFENNDKWKQLRDFVLRFASPGATINTFILDRKAKKSIPLSSIRKMIDCKF